MKRLYTILLLFLFGLPFTSTLSSAPPPPDDEDVYLQVEAAIYQEIEEQRESVLPLLLYETQIDNLHISEDGQWAIAWLNPTDPQTDQIVPAEPGIAVAEFQDGQWNVYLPSDSLWESSLQSVPEQLLSKNQKETWLQFESRYAAIQETAGPFGGYLLPWAKGETMYMTQSVHHDRYTPSGNAHYAFDFAKPGYPSGMFDVYAAKAGIVKRAVWWHPNGNEQYANYLVLEDPTTDPISYQLYLHFAQETIPPALRVVGTPVQQGQFLGVADDTGISSGNHLHFHVHLNPDSFWGRSVDITFDDVPINGGRPRMKGDEPYCKNDSEFQDVCLQFQSTYVSGNVTKSDVTPPQGGFLDPDSDGFDVKAGSLRLEGWATDSESGLFSARFIANYGKGWVEIGQTFNSPLFSTDWNLCENKIPIGPISFSMKLQDNAGNTTLTLPALRQVINNSTCQPPPPICQPTADQAALFSETDFQGDCVLLNPGVYASVHFGQIGDNNASSIRIGSNVQATLYMNNDLSGRGETFNADDSSLLDNRIGDDTLSSILVQPRDSISSPLLIWPADKAALPATTYINLNWDDAGGALEYQARLISDGKTISSTDWQKDSGWVLGWLSPGTYTWQVRARNSAGTSNWDLERSFSIESPAASVALPVNRAVPYQASMESGQNGADDWTHSIYWDLTDSKNHTDGGSISWKYDTNTNLGYDTGSPNAGALTSPVLYIPDEGYFLRFWYQYNTESPSRNWDQRWLQVSVDSEPFTNLLQLSDDPPNFWLQSPVMSLDAYSGKHIQFRFLFATLDANFNTNDGWFIDDFSITDTPPGCTDSADQDNRPETAQTIQMNTSVSGQICPGGDIDYYKFSAKSGDRIGITVDSRAAGFDLDSYVFLLDADGSSILSENDDRIPYEITDSYLTYQITRDGTYYIKIRAWNHPSEIALDPGYVLKLVSDASPPTIEITNLKSSQFLLKVPITIQASAHDPVDGIAGISHVDFYWHSGDWLTGAWELLEQDWNGADGWTAAFDLAKIPDQSIMAVIAQAYDMAGNATTAGVWNLVLAEKINSVFLPRVMK